MKTVKELFEQLPEPYRSQAFKNNERDEYLDMTEPNLYEALRGSFGFFGSPEGNRYWADIAYSREAKDDNFDWSKADMDKLNR